MGIEQIKVQLNPDTRPSGSDLSVVNAARRSFNTRSEWETVGYSTMTKMLDTVSLKDYQWIEGGMSGYYRKLKDKDKRLLQFLARGMTADDFENFKLELGGKGLDWLYYMDNNKEQELLDLMWQWRNTPVHDTPFSHCFVSFEVKAPIFVARQLVKHEYLIMSEFSRRYITDDIEFYTPDVWRGKAENKKQGSAGEVPLGKSVKDNLVWGESEALTNYRWLLESGVAPEQARMVLPQSTMTEWTWSGTLGAFAKMCQLRLHPEAQYEARVVAQQVYDYLKEYYPVSAVALVEGVK